MMKKFLMLLCLMTLASGLSYAETDLVDDLLG